ncbi:RagB/SusD family nutrient uptake outer membrane protein [Parapedobacter indicus]|uniref:Starch-binding associating with outer membrane n=1 Tax=Parapedobacter indicus TaxID=1477437 RepID=A0A1I3G1P8_9SPHI|nr:RagB/SusD family nutrient uptake outer membrane protein [Parapedobacter indicus]PPL03989.1 putative outer membrane starch-binding protein [Parapedobacter indicus]SFI17379.1 Starch-binding associating with outer membrane [Parapedobacter indicus]
MKKRYVLLVVLFALAACEQDFLNQQDPNAVSVDSYFKTENDVLLAVNGIYQVLRSGNTVGEGSALYSEERSDNAGRNDNQSNAGEPFQFNDFSLLAGNTYLRTHWSSMYDGIARCNTLLSRIDQVAFSDDALKQRYIAEAKFVRALLYFHMVRKFGDIPLSVQEIRTKEEASAIAYRQPEATVYQQIVADLTDALASNLPDTQWEYAVGRTSKAAINALLGQVYLTMGATLADNKTEHFQQAEQYLAAAYDMRTFDKLSEIPYAQVFDVAAKNTCKELIFQVQYLQGDPSYSSSIARNNQARGETINSQFNSTGSGTNLKLDLVKDYEAGDLRKEFSVKFAPHAQVNDWFITKFRDNSDAAGTAGWGGNDWILIRYADVMLLLAEAKMHLNKDAEAIALLDEVRERAGLPAYAEARANATYNAKYPTLKDAILHERRVELAFENHRWFDLIRNYNAEELVAYFGQKEQADYGNAQLSNISTKDRYYPIPFDEYKLNPEKMYQNPGY